MMNFHYEHSLILVKRSLRLLCETSSPAVTNAPRLSVHNPLLFIARHVTNDMHVFVRIEYNTHQRHSQLRALTFAWIMKNSKY